MKTPQEKVREFCEQHNLNSPVEHRVLDLTSEVGEVAKEVLKMTDYGRKELTPRKEIREELGDAFFSLITVANSFDVDLEQALEKVLEKYKRRLEKGSAGSEND